MVEFSKFTLENGLRVIVHEDDTTPMVAVNVLYDVGSRDELPEKTGFAHLFEHLMFGGSENVPDFDEPIQQAGGENNAFTNSDITNYYDILPAENIEIAFWLESDRMFNLNFDEQVLATQRKVVVEEFKETCLNQPYGDAWHHLSGLAYQEHPYSWPTIGKVPQHVEEATMEDVKDFYQKYYCPNNAILSIAGKVTLQQIKALTEKWFGNIPKGNIPRRQLQQEPIQDAIREVNMESNVPLDSIYMAFHMPDRIHPDYYVVDLISDILCNGSSSRLYRRLSRDQDLFSNIDCYITGSIDPGVLIIEGKPSEGVDLERAEAAIWREIIQLKKEGISVDELQKVKNKVESSIFFSEMNILNKAINLAFFEVVGDADLMNKELELYQSITESDIQRVASEILTPENCSVLRYKVKPEIYAMAQEQ